MKTLAFFVLAFFPALILAEKPQDKEALCSYLGDRIVGLSNMIDPAVKDIPDEMFKVFTESKICDTIGWTTMDCKGDDNCVEEKTEQMVRKSLAKARKVEKMKLDMNWPGGHEIFHCCKIHAYMKLRAKFMTMKSLLACEPDTTVAGETSRKRRSLLPTQHYQGSGHGYGVNTIWFQYHLCKDEQIYCWFFTDQWGQRQFGDYYLYENLLEDVDFKDDNLLPLALLSGGLGGGYAHGPAHGYAPGYGGAVRYRRGTGTEEDGAEAAGDERGQRGTGLGGAESRGRREVGDDDDDEYKRGERGTGLGGAETRGRREVDYDDDDGDIEYLDDDEDERVERGTGLGGAETRGRREVEYDDDDDNDGDIEYLDDEEDGRGQRGTGFWGDRWGR